MSHMPSSTGAHTAIPANYGRVHPLFQRSSIVLIGAGPRGTSILERIGANLGDPSYELHGRELDLYVVDDAESGAGRTWRTDQPRELCMNTLSHAVTLFTEASSTVAGPIAPGPTLYEWSLLVLHKAFPTPVLASHIADVPHEHAASFAAHPVRPELAADFHDELSSSLPESHPSRALYGEYLAWCYERAVAMLPPNVRVIRHRTRAVGIRREHERDCVALADGTRLDADAVVIAAGWMQRADTVWERRLDEHLSAHPGHTWVRPASPIEQDLSGVAPGAPSIVRGLGMGFYDAMALVTIERGGVFVADTDSDSGLRYEPSGHEPVLHVTSHRGVPFRSKTLYRSLPPRPAQRFVRSVDWSTIERPIDFNHMFWPRAVADAHFSYCETLGRVRPGALSAPLEAVAEALENAVQALTSGSDRHDLRTTAVRIGAVVAEFIPDPADRFDLESELQPAQGPFASPQEYQLWMRRRIVDDLREAELGLDSALKAGLWSLSVARDTANKAGAFGSFDAESRASGFTLVHAIGGRAGSGPPAFRNRQLVALMDAGLVRFIGPEAPISFHANGFSAESPRVANSQVVAATLVDAWMPVHDVAESADPLTHDLVSAGRARPFHITARNGDSVATHGFDVDRATGLLIGSDGSLDTAVHVAGIPVDDALHGTIISPMPGTDPPMLRETDRIARSAIRTVAASRLSSSAWAR